MTRAWLRRSLSGLAGAALLLLTDAVSGAQAQTASLASHAFELDGRSLVIELPPGAAIRIAPDGKYVRIDVRPGTRQPTAMTLRPLREGETAEHFDRTETLAGSRSLIYRVSTASVGSGGPEAFLDGRLTLADRPYVVTCHIQGDPITMNDAAWCLPYLSTLTATGAEAK